MSDNDKPCALCGLPVLVEGFRLRTKEGNKDFCCEGCMGIYQMLHEGEILDKADNSD